MRQNIPGERPLFARIRRDIRFDEQRTVPTEHDEHVIQMNEVHHCASGWVQPAPRNVASMIDEPGHPTGHLAIPF